MIPSGWRHLRKPELCAICGHKDWCTITTDGSVAHCQRVQAGSFKASPTAGWYHRLISGSAPARPTPSPKQQARRWRPPFAKWCEQWRRAADSAEVDRLAASLGVSSDSFRRLGIGWASAIQSTCPQRRRFHGPARTLRRRHDDTHAIQRTWCMGVPQART